MHKLSRIFVKGLVIVIPLGFTLLIVMEVIGWLEEVCSSYLPARLQFPGIGIMSMIGLTMAIGVFSGGKSFRRLLRQLEKIIEIIPVIKFIYNLLKRFSAAVFETENLFRRPVLVEITPGYRVLGFVMSELSPALAEHCPPGTVCVFIPFSLNMTAGVNLLLTKDKIEYLDVANEEALEYILTAGTVMPEKKTGGGQKSTATAE
ncbi:MAG: DUF502 domain-containing protein [Negativicutes bacterium]|nr:DUF502 domain-containing protein [Negativicutes bacterium]